MRTPALFAIRLYQRLLSPRKGYRCAYCAFTGRASCSVLGYRAIQRYGVVQGTRLLRRRLQLCGIVHRRYSLPLRRARLKQRGDCDIGCDAPCDALCSSSCDAPSPGSGSCVDKGGCVDNGCGVLDSIAQCGGPSRRKTAEEEMQTYVPPYTKFVRQQPEQRDPEPNDKP